MNTLKILLTVLTAVIATIGVLAVIGLAMDALFYLFWLAVICLVLALLVKLFGSKDGAPDSTGDVQNRLQGAEQTIEEYKRKLEAEVRHSREKQR